MSELWANAAAAGLVVALLSGPIGYVLVLRGETFAGHALSHLGFAGATGAALIGVSPLVGMVVMTVGSGCAMGALGRRARERDVATGVVLTVALGCGLLFLTLYTAYATQVTALLFGSILGVEGPTVWALAGMSAAAMLMLGGMLRPLLLASLQPELAAARGVPVRGLAVAFLGLVGLAVAEAAQVVGVLLVFALMVGPGAAANLLGRRVLPGMALAAGLAVLETGAGLLLADWTDWPISFWISVLSGAGYGVALAARRAVSHRRLLA